MSKELDTAKAAFDADIANTNGRMSQEEISEVIRKVTNPADQLEFMEYMMDRSVQVGPGNIDYAAITECIEKLTELPTDKEITKEVFEKVSTHLNTDERMYMARLLIKEHARRQKAQASVRDEVLSTSPLNAPGVRHTAIREYVDKLGAIVKQYGSPTRAEYADIMSNLNETERNVVESIRLKVNNGNPMLFRDDKRPTH